MIQEKGNQHQLERENARTQIQSLEEQLKIVREQLINSQNLLTQKSQFESKQNEIHNNIKDIL